MAQTTDRHYSKTVRKVVLDIAPAREVVDLIEDRPGTADEDLLDDALRALEDARPRIQSVDQERAASGEVVAVELTPDAVAAMESLIRRDKMFRARTLRDLADRLRGKIERARHKRRARRS